MIKPSKKKLSRKRMLKALDDDARRRVVIERDRSVCQRCGQRNGHWDDEINQPVIVQWAHVHTREYHCMRWEEDNALGLCKRCHVWFDNHKVLAYDWFAKRFPERWERITKALQFSPTATPKRFVQERYEELMADPPKKLPELSFDELPF